MDWNQTRKKLLQLTTGRNGRPGALERPSASPEGRESHSWTSDPRLDPIRPSLPDTDRRLGRAVRARSLCIASGKGGTGKSVVTAALAALFSPRGRTLILDADLGVGNAHILQDVSPPRTMVDVVDGHLGVREVCVPCSGQIDLVAAGSGVPRMADLTTYEMHLIATGLEELELDYRFLLVDSAAGVSRQTLSFAQACDVTLIVTTPDLTAMTDAYAFIKVLLARRRGTRPLLLVNRVRGEREALEVQDRIGRVCDRFLGTRPHPIGWLPEDPAVSECVNRRGSVVVHEPRAPSANALRRTAVTLLEELGRQHPRGLGLSLLRDVGYSTRLA